MRPLRPRRLAGLLASFVLMNQGAIAVAATPEEELAAQKTQTALAEERAKTLKAQADLADAQRRLAKSQSDLGVQQDELADKKAVADAAASLATARTNAKIAEEIGAVAGTTYSGKVTLDAKSGTIESLLLAARAAKDVCNVIAYQIKDISGLDTGINVIGRKDFSNFRALTDFRVKRDLIQQALEVSVKRAADIKSFIDKDQKAAIREAGAGPAMISAGLKALEGLTTYFKTDYDFVGVDTKLEETAAVAALAGAIKRARPTAIVRMPATSELQLAVTGSGTVASDLSLMANKIAEASGLRDHLANKSSTETKAAIDPVLADLDSVIKAGQTFVSSYGGGSADVTTALARDLVMEARLNNDELLAIIGVENTGGGYFVRKSIWSGLFGAPVYHMGGVTISYSILNKDGVLASGLIPYHGGFVKSSKVAARVQQGK